MGSVPLLPYPTCGAAELAPGEPLAAGHLRPGLTSLESRVDERFELRRRACLYGLTVRQEWPLAVADVEVLFDEAWLPLRVWKRMTLPGSRRHDGNADTRLYELRGSEVTIRRRDPQGLRFELLRGTRPRAVIGPGRGLLTAWLRRARLREGQRVREPVLDFREQVEVLRDVTLRREPDQYVAALGRVARLYSIYGREVFYADETDTVVGDMAGLAPASMVRQPPLPLMPLFGPPDPVHTP